MIDRPLHDRVALITGASSGQGRAFAKALAAAGASVFAVARREERLRALVDEITAAGGEAAYHVVDLRSVPSVYDLVDVALAKFRRLHVLVNAAGVGYRAPLAETSRTQIAEMIETDLTAMIHLTQAALPALLHNAPADVINLASIAGLRGFPEGSVYCAVKHGVVGFTRALSAELKDAGVRVTAICSGSVDTEFFERFRPKTERELRLDVEDSVRALMYVLRSPPDVLHGEIVLRPRVVKEN